MKAADSVNAIRLQPHGLNGAVSALSDASLLEIKAGTAPHAGEPR